MARRNKKHIQSKGYSFFYLEREKKCYLVEGNNFVSLLYEDALTAYVSLFTMFHLLQCLTFRNFSLLTISTFCNISMTVLFL